MDHPRTTIQMGLGEGFGPDFPDPSTFFGPLLSCHLTEGNGSNFAEFCDPRVDALARQAQAVQLTDPAAARRLWAQADRLVTDEAPYVPVYNGADAGFVSSRAGNYQASPVYGPLLDQIWVR
jgi:peptide/nickel transport system substrate-binding protein